MIDTIIDQLISDFNENQNSIRELDTLNLKMLETMREFNEPVQDEVEILEGFDFDSNDIDEDVVVEERLVEGQDIQQH